MKPPHAYRSNACTVLRVIGLSTVCNMMYSSLFSILLCLEASINIQHHPLLSRFRLSSSWRHGLLAKSLGSTSGRSDGLGHLPRLWQSAHLDGPTDRPLAPPHASLLTAATQVASRSWSLAPLVVLKYEWTVSTKWNNSRIVNSIVFHQDTVSVSIIGM